MKFNILSKLALGAMAFALVACDEDYTKAEFDAPVGESYDLPTVVTGDLVAATGSAAVLTASIDAVVEGNPIKQWGVVVGTSEDLTLTNGQMVNAAADATETSVSVSNLADETKYYYRAYAYTEGGVALGDIKDFRTSNKAWDLQWEAVGPTSLPFGSIEDINAAFSSNHILNAVNYQSNISDGWIACDVSTIFGPGMFGLVSSAFDNPTLFAELTGYQACYASDNLAGFAMDFTDKAFPKVTFSAVMMQGLFGNDGLDGHFDVYVTKDEITSPEDFANAKLIGSTRSNGAATTAWTTDYETSPEAPMSFDIPSEFWGPCYIYINSKIAIDKASVTDYAPVPDWGVVILDVSLSAYTKK